VNVFATVVGHRCLYTAICDQLLTTDTLRCTLYLSLIIKLQSLLQTSTIFQISE